MTQQSDNVIDRWHDMMAHGTTEGLYDLLAHDCVFWSPVVHTPQQGQRYHVLIPERSESGLHTDFRYVREVRDGDSAVLEFECTMDGIHVNGIDMIQAANGQITEFKVMVRPLKAVNKVHERMMRMLEKLKASAS